MQNCRAGSLGQACMYMHACMHAHLSATNKAGCSYGLTKALYACIQTALVQHAYTMLPTGPFCCSGPPVLPPLKELAQRRSAWWCCENLHGICAADGDRCGRIRRAVCVEAFETPVNRTWGCNCPVSMVPLMCCKDWRKCAHARMHACRKSFAKPRNPEP